MHIKANLREGFLEKLKLAQYIYEYGNTAGWNSIRVLEAAAGIENSMNCNLAH
jgi:hypothetical protein